LDKKIANLKVAFVYKRGITLAKLYITHKKASYVKGIFKNVNVEGRGKEFFKDDSGNSHELKYAEHTSDKICFSSSEIAGRSLLIPKLAECHLI